ncbi:aldehyde dehydrogenase (NAD+) [Burkholderia sp. OK233]|nr:aldehyde dehydrogenase (NAD+) [Burkholderia sp. OK233]
MKLDVAYRGKNFIDGNWVQPSSQRTADLIDPSDESVCGVAAVGTVDDIKHAVQAARTAFPAWSATSSEDRARLFERAIAILSVRNEEIAHAISREMGAPLPFAKDMQAMCGVWHMGVALELLRTYKFSEDLGTTRIVKEPIGVCALVTPWNWPLNQLVCKVAPALAAGCTVVVKPAQITPLSAMIFAEVLSDAGFPPGVFNLVLGEGAVLGEALASHPDVDMVSFTGSTRAGVSIAVAAAPTVKRVSQELGGKSANIILDDSAFAEGVASGTANCFSNSGQTCIAPTRMLVPKSRMAEAVEIARKVADDTRVGHPSEPSTVIGPVASKRQFETIQRYIKRGIEEGATLVAGGPGRPDGMQKGYYVRPTVFADVSNQMTIAREEIFGPVLSIIGYDDEDHAVEVANDSPFGLSGYVSSSDVNAARRIALRLRTGMVHLNGAFVDFNAPFGGYKTSGNGREWGRYGFEEFLETKAIMGFNQ